MGWRPLVTKEKVQKVESGLESWELLPREGWGDSTEQRRGSRERG